MRFCEVQQCGKPVFGTDKKTRTGYCKSHQYLRTDIDKDGIVARAIKRQRTGAALKAGRSLRLLAVTDEKVREGGKKVETKSQLLKQADDLFARYIKNRDKNKNGEATCPCCGYNVLVELNGKFNPDCNILHFIDRDVYSLRYDEDAAAAGHSWCNRNQHYNPKGKEYQNFKNHLVEKFGEVAVAEMEVAHRKINKITEQQLRTVIEHYSNQPLNT